MTEMVAVVMVVVEGEGEAREAATPKAIPERVSRRAWMQIGQNPEGASLWRPTGWTSRLSKLGRGSLRNMEAAAAVAAAVAVRHAVAKAERSAVLAAAAGSSIAWVSLSVPTRVQRVFSVPRINLDYFQWNEAEPGTAVSSSSSSPSPSSSALDLLF